MNSLRLSILIVCGLLAAAPSNAANDRKAARQACDDVKRKIRKLESRMRIGYSAAQGIRLEQKLRKLKDERYRVCR